MGRVSRYSLLVPLVENAKLMLIAQLSNCHYNYNRSSCHKGLVI